MLHRKDLLGLTGYMRGGCSPVGMKKKFPTYFDASIEKDRPIALSAGKRGYQMIVSSKDITTYCDAKIGDVVRSLTPFYISVSVYLGVIDKNLLIFVNIAILFREVSKI